MKISVITATWNCDELLGNCLTSFAKQNYANKEHIVIDGASTDGTISLIQEHIKQITVFISEPDFGIYDALNKGIQASSGDVIGFLHSDDLYNSEEVLGFIAKAFEDPSVCAVFGDLEYVMRQDIKHVVRRWRGNAFKMSDLSYGWMPAHPTFYVRRDWYIKIGGFDTSFKISADYHSIQNFFFAPRIQSGIHIKSFN
jgi:glycosyltransferase involved in cell wall biosynthesis